MAVWGQLGLQEGARRLMYEINIFHDYIIILLTLILFFVIYIFICVISSSGLDKFITESHFLELIWTVSPILLLFFMAYPSLQLLYLTEDSIDCSVVVKAVGHQWYWEYQYNRLDLHFSFDSYMINYTNLDSDFTLYRNLDVDNRMVLPINLRSLILVTSADVLHSWTIPRLGVKADAIPGRLNQLVLSPLYSGVYYGQCSELCGSNHSFIPITLEAISGEDFISWLKLQVNN